jgi:hypothetical protein
MEVEENEMEEEGEEEQHMSDENLRLAPPSENVGEDEDENEVEENDKEEEDEEEEHVSEERLRPAPLYMMTGDCTMAEQQRGRLLCARTLPSQVFLHPRKWPTRAPELTGGPGAAPGGVASKNGWVCMRVQGGFISYGYFVCPLWHTKWQFRSAGYIRWIIPFKKNLKPNSAEVGA